MSSRDARLNQLLRVFIDGVPLDMASALLPLRTRLNTKIGLHLHLHAAVQKRFERRPADAPPNQSATLGQAAQSGLIDSLESTVQRLNWEPTGTIWTNYYHHTNYSDAALAHKTQLVDALIARTQPTIVWDLGANTGRFSRLASGRGIQTIAFDMDPAAVETNYRESVSRRETHLLPLIVDLRNPSSALGWAGEERMSLMARGTADLVLALALVHHVAIGNNVPLDRIAAWLAALGRTLVIEFVPKSDSQVQRLLASREDVFPTYTHVGFESAFAPHFETLDVSPIASTDRILYLMRRKAS